MAAAFALGLRAAGEEALPMVAGYFPSWGIYERNDQGTNMPADPVSVQSHVASLHFL
jgi:hypothetical protein